MLELHKHIQYIDAIIFLNQKIEIDNQEELHNLSMLLGLSTLEAIITIKYNRASVIDNRNSYCYSIKYMKEVK